MADHAREERLMTVNKDGRSGRLEIANYVGKPEQDAFTGGMYTSELNKARS
ncbi:MAG: hypothetical protein L6R41_002181 [Letrouitia leprolyta]|nr:MAG: hypothetical protein L6R41_002181 [Letrouitia leprolyta]